MANPFGQGLNAYSYVEGRPLHATDPSGWQLRPDDYRPGPNGEPITIVVAPTGSSDNVDGAESDSAADERAGAGAAGAATNQSPARELGHPRGEGARDLGNPLAQDVARNAYGFNSDEMAAAARAVEPTMASADMIAHVGAWTAAVPLAVFGAAEVAAGGVMGVVLAASETSVGASQALSVATQLAEGFLADAMGGITANPVPVLTGAGGVLQMAGQAGDDIARATSRATVATTGSGGGTRLALGLNAGGRVERWASSVNAQTYWDLFDDTTDMRVLGSRLLQAMDAAREIHFNLDGLVGPGRSARQVFEWGATGIGQGNVTNWEFYQVVSHFADRATFYLEGRVVTLPELGL